LERSRLAEGVATHDATEFKKQRTASADSESPQIATRYKKAPSRRAIGSYTLSIIDRRAGAQNSRAPPLVPLTSMTSGLSENKK